MGLTTGCAVCHDHKFDPITQKDFYSLAAFFNNTTQARWTATSTNTPPIMSVPRTEDRPRFELQRRNSPRRKRTGRAQEAARTTSSTRG